MVHCKIPQLKLIAVPRTGSVAPDKLAPSQPKRRKEKLPPLLKTDFKVIIRPKNWLNISQLSTQEMAWEITKARGNPRMCNEGNLLIRLRNGSNIAVISTPNMETANAGQIISSLRFGASDYAVTACVAAPDNSCKGVIHGLDVGTTPTELLARLRVRTQGVKILYIGNSQAAVITFEGKVVPRYVYYYGGETRCYPYRSSRQVGYMCFTPGHRADLCPTPDAVVCSNCADPVIEDEHTGPTRSCATEHNLNKPMATTFSTTMHSRILVVNLSSEGRKLSTRKRKVAGLILKHCLKWPSPKGNVSSNHRSLRT
ncbi:hypothetical protein HPB50_020230 [Hyalomma asiaticum]|uniref:Uncharacterized protein n=1 Tax=Hyalomma asiaticum TaxID=266040 RepID=A0ACB7SYE7_HYAAI|nr:hypothetical protein HPB50_020230 [Hyalomma asiaticum]